ncbi:hypothetical protein HPB49_015286 [Dermacentor silvarum]|uniref:Uncharacterized protein n=1 Tax=Dermacentor silvarum TaxID=543639 RepID=A0ACB8DE46_DERSI|nr:hypothetical protein HPB49_015286 [Dermacentor silvarum]
MSITTEDASSSFDEQTASSDPTPSASGIEPSGTHNEAPHNLASAKSAPPSDTPKTATGMAPQSLPTSVRDASGFAGERTTSNVGQPAVSGPNPVLVEEKNPDATFNDQKHPGSAGQNVKLEEKHSLAEPVSHKRDDEGNRVKLGSDAPPELQRQDTNTHRSSPMPIEESILAAPKSGASSMTDTTEESTSDEERGGASTSGSSAVPESKEAGDRGTRVVPVLKSDASSGNEPSSSVKPATSSVGERVVSERKPTSAEEESAAVLSTDQGRRNTGKKEEQLELNQSLAEPASREGNNLGGDGQRGSGAPRQIQRQGAVTSHLSTNERKESLSTAPKTEESSETENKDESSRDEEGARISVSGTSFETRSQQEGDRSTSVTELSANQNATRVTKAEERLTMEEQKPPSFRKPEPQDISRAESRHRLSEVASTDRRIQGAQVDGGVFHSTRRLSRSVSPDPVGGRESQNVAENIEARSGMKRPPSGLFKDSASQKVSFQTTSKPQSPVLSSHLPFAASRTFSVTEMLRPDLQITAPGVEDYGRTNIEKGALEAQHRTGTVSSDKLFATTSTGRRMPAAQFLTPEKYPSKTLKSKLVLDDMQLLAEAPEAARHPTPTASKKLMQKQESSNLGSHEQQSRTEQTGTGFLKLPATQNVSSPAAMKSDPSTIPSKERSQQAGISFSRREELVKTTEREPRDTVSQSNRYEAYKGAVIKSVSIADERVHWTAEEASKRFDASKSAVAEATSKDIQPSRLHSNKKRFSKSHLRDSKVSIVSKKAALPDSSPLSILVSERVKEVGGVSIKDKIQSTAGFGMNVKSESNKEISLLGRRTSHASTTRSAYSRKSTTGPTAPDLAQAANFVTAEPGLPIVDQPGPSERFLYPMAMCLALVLVLFLGILFWPSNQPPRRDEQIGPSRHSARCSSVSCLQNAVYLSNLLSWRDVDPCNDFYAFVCRRWKSRFGTLFKDQSISTDDDYAAFLEDRVYASIRNYSGSSKMLRPLRDLHEKCMNVRLIEDEGWNALLELMSDLSLDGFPLTPPVRDSISVWSTAANILRKTGSAALLSVGVASHAASANNDIVSVGPPELLTTTGNVDANEAIRLYTFAVFTAIKALKKDYVPPVEILAIVKFASDLEKLGQSRVNADASKINILDSPSDLLEFLTAVFRGREASIFTGARSYVAIHSPELVSDVIDVVVNTEPHTVMNYLGVRLMIQIAPFIPQAGVTNFYSTMVYGKRRTAPSRWQLCVRATEKALQPLVHSALFHDARLKASMPSIADVVGKIIAEFTGEVDASSLFEDSSKAAIHRILSTIEVDIVSPSWINDTASIADYVHGLPPFKATRRGLETYVAFFQHTFFDSLSRGTRTRWSHSIFSANCWYESYPRTLYVPLIVFNVTQAFEKGDVDYVQLSRVAPRLSRCLLDILLEETNSTDDTVHWLTEKTRRRLSGVEDCLRGRTKSVGLGRLRDVLAARVAFRIFQKSNAAKQELATSLLDGRVMTSTQVFFVYLMLQSCETLSDADQAWPAGVDDWIIALRDSGDFTSAYNCTSGSSMNAKQSCVH